MTKQIQLIYMSRPFGFDINTLEAILFSARYHNKRDGITGALVCRDDLFLQILEGPQDAVSKTYERILRDDRHVEIVHLLTGELETRLFPTWDMRHDPARSWLWSREEVQAGAVQDASPQTLLAIFARIAAEPGEADSAVL